MKKNTPPSKSTKIIFEVSDDKDLLKYAKTMIHPWPLMWRNFIAGTFHGVGFTLGTAVVLAIVGYSTSQLLDLTGFFTDFAQAINIWLETTLKGTL